MNLHDRITEAWTSHAERGEPLDVATLEGWLPETAGAEGRRIGEVAAELGVSAHTIRYYERIGLLAVARDDAGVRRYDTASLGRLMFVVRMRGSGMSTAELQRYFRLVDQGPATCDERVAMLREHRAALQRRLHELELSLAVTEHKIDRYVSGAES